MAPAAQLAQYCFPARDRFAERYLNLDAERRGARTARRTAEHQGDTVGVQHAKHQETEAGEALDGLDLFRKNLQSFVRAYEFLSQIVEYDDRELEQLCVFAKHLYPLLSIDRLDDEEIDVSELALTHYRLTKRAEHELVLGEQQQEYGLKPLSEVGSGTAHDPEKKLLSEIIDALNEIFGADVSDADKLHFAQGVADRISRDEQTMAQVNNHSAEQVMHGLFPKRVEDAVLDSMSDHEKLALQILDNEGAGREFARLILRLLVSEQQLGA